MLEVFELDGKLFWIGSGLVEFRSGVFEWFYDGLCWDYC